MAGFKKTKQTLIDEYNNIVEKHNLLAGNINTLSNSILDSRLTRGAFLSMMTYFGAVLSLPQIINSGISPDLISPFLLTGAITVGVLGETLYTKLRGYKNKLSKIGKFYTQKDYIAAEARCEIAHTTCHSMMKMINQACDDLETKEDLSSTLSSVNQATMNKNASPVTELENRIVKLEALYQTKLDEIKTASTQVTLIEKFNRTRSSVLFDTIFNGFVYYTASTCAGLAVYGMPNICLYNRGLIETQTDPNALFTFSLATGVLGLGYYIKRNLNHKSVYSELNNQLLDNKIPNRANQHIDSKYQETLDKAINAAAVIRLELENTKRQLESLTNSEENGLVETALQNKDVTPKKLQKTNPETK